jgi:hypothetical protein
VSVQVGEAYLALRIAQDQFAADLAKLRTDLTHQLEQIEHDTSRIKLASLFTGVESGLELFGRLRGMIGGFAAELLDPFMKAEVGTARLNAALRANAGVAGFNADQMDVMRDRLIEYSGASAGAVKSAQAFLLTQQDIRGARFEQTLKLAADMAAASGEGMDTVSEKAHLLARALEHPESAARMLRRAFVNLTGTEQETLAQLSKSADPSAITDMQDVILQATQRSVGGQAEAYKGTLQGELDNTKHKFEEVKVALGEAFAPAARAAVEMLGEMIGWLQEPIAVVSTAMKNLRLTWDVVVAGVAYRLSQAMDVIQTMFEGMFAVAYASFNAIHHAASATWHNMKALFTGGETTNIFKEMGRGWTEAMDEYMSKHQMGTSARTMVLQKEYEDLKTKFRTLKEDAMAVKEMHKELGSAPATPSNVYDRKVVEVKMEVVSGAEAFAKKLTESIGGQDFKAEQKRYQDEMLAKTQKANEQREALFKEMAKDRGRVMNFQAGAFDSGQ